MLVLGNTIGVGTEVPASFNEINNLKAPPVPVTVKFVNVCVCPLAKFTFTLTVFSLTAPANRGSPL